MDKYKVRLNQQAFREIPSRIKNGPKGIMPAKDTGIDNYIAIFRIDESNKTVYVVTVQYQGRNI